MKRRISVQGCRELLCRDINMVGIDVDGYIKYYHKRDFMYIREIGRPKLEDYYSIICKNLDKIIVMQFSTDTLHLFFLKNKKLHSVQTFAYSRGSSLEYYIDGEHLTKKAWTEHPKVKAWNRKRKIQELSI